MLNVLLISNSLVEADFFRTVPLETELTVGLGFVIIQTVPIFSKSLIWKEN